MGRELRRKEQKKNKNKINIEKQEELEVQIKGTTLIKIFTVIVLILVVLYFIVAVFITKEIDISNKSKDSDSSETSSSSSASSVSNAILGANIFNQQEETYYVYCYDFNDEDDGVSQAINSESETKIYKLDTSSSLNSKYVTKESGNKNATSLDNLSVSNPTLLVISGDKITGYYEGRSSIINFLSE